MIAYLCGAHPTFDLAMVEYLGFRGIRYDIRNPQDIQALDRLPQHPKLTPLCIVDKYEFVIPLAEALVRLGRGAIELVNEPDLNDWKPEDWAGFTKAAYPAIKAEGPIPVVSGGVSNLNHRQIDYWRKAINAGLQFDVLGWHRYRTESPPEVPLQDYQSRRGEFEAISALADGKPAWCTETGWHNADRWSEAETARFASEEQDIQREAGVPVMCWYQITDGPTPHYEDHFGITRTDGTLKPAAHVWKES